MLFPACNAPLYERAGLHGHPNCRDNLMNALRDEGITLPFAPDPVDFFQNSPPQPDGGLDVLESINPPGGFVVLKAEMEALLRKINVEIEKLKRESEEAVQAFEGLQQRKRQEESRMHEVVAHFIEGGDNPVTLGTTPPAGPGQPRSG